MILNEAGKSYADQLFTEPVEVTAPGVRFLDCRFQGSDPNQVLLRPGPATTVDHCTLTGSPNGQRAGIRLDNAANVRVLNSTIRNIYHVSDAQAISGDNGVANLIVDGCYLEASGENVIFGGSDPQDEAHIPQDILIRRCTMTKPLGWRDQQHGTCKNLFELKNAKRVTLEDCDLSYSWVHGQIGFGVVLTVRNQDNTAPWSTLDDIIVRRNIIRAVAGGFQILGTDYTNPSATSKRMTIEDNRVEIDSAYGWNGRSFQIGGHPEDLTIRRNLVRGTGIQTMITFSEGAPLPRFTFTDNDLYEGEYGVFGDGVALGTVALETYAPNCVWSGNIVRRDPQVGRNIPYPAGTEVVML